MRSAVWTSLRSRHQYPCRAVTPTPRRTTRESSALPTSSSEDDSVESDNKKIQDNYTAAVWHSCPINPFVAESAGDHGAFLPAHGADTWRMSGMNLKAIMIATCSATAMAIAPNVAEAATGGSPAVTNGSGQSLAASPSTPASTSDSLYVGDAGHNSVRRFDAATGQDLGNFVTPGNGGLNGPRGILHDVNFLVSNQNVGQSIPGEIDQYGVDGKPLGALVSHTDTNAPFAPDGVIRGPDNRTLYVADQVGNNTTLGRVA